MIIFYTLENYVNWQCGNELADLCVYFSKSSAIITTSITIARVNRLNHGFEKWSFFMPSTLSIFSQKYKIVNWLHCTMYVNCYFLRLNIELSNYGINNSHVKELEVHSLEFSLANQKLVINKVRYIYVRQDLEEDIMHVLTILQETLLSFHFLKVS